MRTIKIKFRASRDLNSWLRHPLQIAIKWLRIHSRLLMSAWSRQNPACLSNRQPSRPKPPTLLLTRHLLLSAWCTSIELESRELINSTAIHDCFVRVTIRKTKPSRSSFISAQTVVQRTVLGSVLFQKQLKMQWDPREVPQIKNYLHRTESKSRMIHKYLHTCCRSL